jgi:hypothetical protein
MRRSMNLPFKKVAALHGASMSPPLPLKSARQTAVTAETEAEALLGNRIRRDIRATAGCKYQLDHIDVALAGRPYSTQLRLLM